MENNAQFCFYFPFSLLTLISHIFVSKGNTYVHIFISKLFFKRENIRIIKMNNGMHTIINYFFYVLML